MGGACSAHGRGDKCIQEVVWKPERNRPRGRPRWETKTDIEEIEREVVD